MKKDLKLKQAVIYIYLISGICWLILGFMDFLPKRDPYELIRIILSGIMCITTFYAIIRGHEKFDEMGNEHYNEACTLGFLAITIAIFICYIICIVYRELPARFILPFIIGVGFLTIGSRFVSLERGDSEDE